MKRELEQEWLSLMMQAKKMGITVEEVRRFLQQGSLEGGPHPENKAIDT